VIDEGSDHPHDLIISNDEQSSCMKIGLPNVEYFLFNQIVESLLLLYPDGFISEAMQSKFILASTKQVMQL
jgi:hypothetical protein